LSEDLLAIADGPGSIGSYSEPEVLFEEIAVDFLQACFWITSVCQLAAALNRNDGCGRFPADDVLMWQVFDLSVAGERLSTTIRYYWTNRRKKLSCFHSGR
jgi:hypothetical protein